jgi:hypothetical protein
MLLLVFYVLGDDEHGLNTGQVIRYAQKKGDLAVVDAARKIAQLIRWNVGAVWVDDRHILACVPPAATNARDLVGAIAALDDDPDYRFLVSGVWDLPKPYKETAQQIVRVLVILLRNNPAVDDRLVAAIWASWLDKIFLRPEVPFNTEEHLAGVLVLVCWELRDLTSSAARTMWSAFTALVARRHGARMDEGLENEAIKVVGRMIASGTTANEQLRRRADDLLAAVRRGLTEGTAPDQYLMDGFDERRNEQAAELVKRRK